jgi:PucR family transcriptional regulator, purine catabolism regulatory protein
MAESITLGQLLALDVLPDVEVIGDDRFRGRRVRMVVPGTSARDVGDLPPDALVLFSRAQLAVEEISADLAIRRGVTAGIAGIVMQRAERGVPLATRRLAEKFGVPLLLLPKVDPAALVAALDPYVREPAILGADLLRTVVERLSSGPMPATDLLGRTAAALGCPVALVDTEGRVVEGDPEALDDRVRADFRALAVRPAAGARVLTGHGGAQHVVHPAATPTGAPANLWFVATLPANSAFAIDAARTGLAIAAVAFTAHIATAALGAERQTRQRALLLTEILEQGDTPRRRTVERATAAGWRLSGWHTAIQIASRSARAADRPLDVTASIDERLREHGIAVGLIERPGGWACWTSHDVEQTPAEVAALVRSVRRILLTVERDHPGAALCAGVGGTHAGTAGLRRSLQEAQEACLLARTEDVPAAVEHVDPMNVKRLLIGWYASGPLRDVAAGLIEPLVRFNPDGDLVRTLRAYLDHESNSTTAANVLGVHRNTVLNRLERIRTLLPIDLDRADERLAVHLAVHVAALGGDVES